MTEQQRTFAELIEELRQRVEQAQEQDKARIAEIDRLRSELAAAKDAATTLGNRYRWHASLLEDAENVNAELRKRATELLAGNNDLRAKLLDQNRVMKNVLARMEEAEKEAEKERERANTLHRQFGQLQFELSGARKEVGRLQTALAKSQEGHKIQSERAEYHERRADEMDAHAARLRGELARALDDLRDAKDRKIIDGSDLLAAWDGAGGFGDDGWITWDGTQPMTLPVKTRVDVRFRQGKVREDHPVGSLRWTHTPVNSARKWGPDDIVAYRIVKADDEGWIEWNGDWMPPLSPAIMVDVKFRDGTLQEARPSGALRWSHANDGSAVLETRGRDIVAYRLTKGKSNG